MTRQLLTFFVLATALLMICSTVFAHHGEAGSYDNSMRITVKATVSEIIWTNPHAQLFFDFKNDKGVSEHWGVEMLSPGNLVRIGWNRDTIKPGDSILVSMTPAWNDRPFGNCGHIVSPAGKMFVVGQCGVPDGNVAKLPVKAGYTAVEIKFPEKPKGIGNAGASDVTNP